MAEFSLLNLEVSSLLSLEHLRPWRKFWSQGQLTTAEDHKHIILEKWLLVSGLDFNFYIKLPNVSNCNLIDPLSTPLTQGRPKSFLKDRKYLLFLVSKSSYQVGTKTFCVVILMNCELCYQQFGNQWSHFTTWLGNLNSQVKFKLIVKERSDIKIMSLHLKSNFKK